MDHLVEQLMPQAFVGNNREVIQQLMEFIKSMWSGKEKLPCRNHYDPKVTVHEPKAAPSEEKHQRLHIEGSIGLTKIIQPGEKIK